MSNKDLNKENELLNILHQALIQKGEDLPQSVEDVEKIEEVMKSEDIAIPESFHNPLCLLNKNKNKNNMAKFPSSSNSDYSSIFAQAAREGGEISEEIRKKMIEDRKKAENESKEK